MSGSARDLLKRYYCIRCKLCKVGAVLSVVCFALAVLTIYVPALWSLFVFALVDWVVCIVPAFYVEVVDKEK